MRQITFYLLATTILVISSCKKDETTPTDNNPPNDPSPSLPAEYAALAGIFNEDGVGAAFNLGQDIVVIINSSGTQYAWLQDDEIKFTRDMSAANSHFTDAAFPIIGAATQYYDYRVYFFDEDGERYSHFDFDVTQTENAWQDSDYFDFYHSSDELSNWGGWNDNPFVEVRAAWIYSHPGEDCFDAAVSANQIWMIGRDGDEVVYYSAWDGFDTEMDLEDWTAENNCGGPDGLIPFDAVGAAFRLVRPNLIQEVFFDLEGSQFCYYNVSEGVFSDIYELY